MQITKVNEELGFVAQSIDCTLQEKKEKKGKEKERDCLQSISLHNKTYT